MPVLDSYPQIRGLILDMDGVLWKDSQPIGDLPAVFARIKELGLKVTLATNNATKTIDEFCQKILGFGVVVSSWQIVNSSMAAGYYLQKHFASSGKVYVVGESGLKDTLKEYGFEAVDNPQAHEILAVVAGMDRFLTYDKLRKAALLIRSGCPFIGTNPDQTFPTPDGLVPGAGSILALLETATSVKPIIAGKPSPTLFNLALERMELSVSEALAVGDRMDTDIAGGQAIGCLTAAVLSGVSSVQDVQAWRPKPDIIIADLSSLVGLPH